MSGTVYFSLKEVYKVLNIYLYFSSAIWFTTSLDLVIIYKFAGEYTA
jgi:hypothetical protein